MISTLLTAVVKWVRTRSPALSALNHKQRSKWLPAPLTLEVLEDRCLPSSTTTVPPMSEIPQQIALMDLMFASQPKGNPSAVFVGDSINSQYAYGSGALVWATYMAPLGMVNYGVPGQTTQSLLFQLSLGQLAGIQPAVVVLEIGANNLLFQGNTPQETAEGVLADIAMIQQYQPQAQVIVLGVLPGEQSPNDPYRTLVSQTNQLLSQMLAGRPHVTFVNFGSMFVQPDGTISSSMMYDYVHPSQQGYMDLTHALLPVIEPFLVPNVTVPPLALPSFAFPIFPYFTVSLPSSGVPMSPP